LRKIQDAERIRAEGGDVAPVLRELNVIEATCYRRRNQLESLKAEDAKTRKHVGKQNLQLKKRLTEAELEKEVLKELAEGNF
jgi:putative transposase